MNSCFNKCNASEVFREICAGSGTYCKCSISSRAGERLSICMWAFQTLPSEELSIDIRSKNKLLGKFKLKLKKIACYRIIKDHRLNFIPILHSTPHNSHKENRQESESWKEFFPNKVAFGALCLKKVKHWRKRNLLLLKCITSFDFNSI